LLCGVCKFVKNQEDNLSVLFSKMAIIQATITKPITMKLRCLIFLFFVNFVSCKLLADDGKLEQSNINLSLHDFLSGVKYAFIDLDDKEQADIDQNRKSVLLNNFANYLRSIGFAAVCISTQEKQAVNNIIGSMCDIAHIKVDMYVDDKDNYFTNHFIQLLTCQGDYYRFRCNDTLYRDKYLADKLYTVWKKMYSQKNTYNEQYRLKLPQRPTKWKDEATISHYFEQNQTEKLEGIYEKVVDKNTTDKIKLAIIKDTFGYYDAIYLGGSTNYKDWVAGEMMGKIQPTATTNYYKVRWYKTNKELDDNVFMSVDTVGKLYLTFASKIQVQYQKKYPLETNQPQRKIIATGSGVAISADGYIVTNSHVVAGGKQFAVESTTANGYRQKYAAVLLLTDEQNDLAVLKIKDWNFKTFGQLPFGIRTEIAGLGESVFTLGYPLAASMGDNVKLMNGIISSTTGFKNDLNTYQISAQVQPGNSGGPLFDEYGNLIGIIKSRHADATNVTYAIKSHILQKILEASGEKVNLPLTLSKQTAPLPQLVKRLEDYVFFIKVYE
jgi:S1-C subfamily serine protease